LRFYCPDPPRGGRFCLPADEARHLSRVCRYGVGDRVEVFDGKGFATLAQIALVDKDRVELVALGPPIAEVSSPCSLTLATAIPKGERFDWMVEKATELGVARLIPLVAERSVVNPRESKLDRLRRTIVEAAKQSRRNRLMVLEAAMTWPDVVSSRGEALCLIADPEGLPPFRWPVLKAQRELILAVGPEGGFSPAEMEIASAGGWHPIRLGVNVLRIETAAIAGAATIMARCQEQNADERN
jgi:16S rRNA (uracil1498-N3)-methyltransferase